MAKQHATVRAARLARDELQRRAPALAEALLGDGAAPDAARMTEHEFVEYVRSGWTGGLPKGGKSPEQFRLDLLTQMGPEAFMDLAEKVLKPLQSAEPEPLQQLLAVLAGAQAPPVPQLPTLPAPTLMPPMQVAMPLPGGME